jgi:hypothetical protein
MHTPKNKPRPRSWWLLPAFLALLPSCTRHSTIVPNGCISRVVPNYTINTLSAGANDSIQALFAANNLSTNDLQFVIFSPQMVFGTPPNSSPAQVSAVPFINGLPVFTDDFFTFDNGILKTTFLYQGKPQNNDSTGHQSLSLLQIDFLVHVSQVTIGGGALNSVPTRLSPATYRDSCLLATLGYLDASQVPGNSAPWGETLIKVWKVTPLNGNFPTVYVEDDNGLAWGEPELTI